METLDIVRDELKTILNVSKSTALKDNIISKDEAELINLLENQLFTISEELEEIVKMLDDKMTEKEVRKRVKLVSADIIPSLTDKARADDVVTAEEAALIDSIINQIL